MLLKKCLAANLSINCELIPPKSIKFVFSDPGDINLILKLQYNLIINMLMDIYGELPKKNMKQKV